MTFSPPRLLKGYGETPPVPEWKAPNGERARVVVQFVVNYEEGGEHCLLNGDDRSEWLLSEIVGAASYEGVRHMNMESLYEYGSRVGFWRLHKMFRSRGMVSGRMTGTPESAPVCTYFKPPSAGIL